MSYKIREIDKKYMLLKDGIPKDVTYRHLGIAFILVSIPILGNIVALLMGIKCLWKGKL